MIRETDARIDIYLSMLMTSMQPITRFRELGYFAEERVILHLNIIRKPEIQDGGSQIGDTYVRRPSFISDFRLHHTRYREYSFIEFLDLKNMGIAVEIVQLCCIQDTYFTIFKSKLKTHFFSQVTGS